VSKKDKTPRQDHQESEREDAFDEADAAYLQDVPEDEENVSKDRKYWEQFYEDEDEQMFQRRQKKFKDKGKSKPKSKDSDRE